MQGTITKWGNSLAVRVPRHLAESAKLVEGSSVDLAVEDDALIIRSTRRRYKLAELLAADNGAKHDEADLGQPKGEEVW